MQRRSRKFEISSCNPAMKKPIDYLILAPLEEELAALKDALGIPNDRKSSVYRDDTPYWPITIGRQGGLHPAIVHVAKLKYQGVLNAAVATTRLLQEIPAACVVSFGVAGGFIEKNDETEVSAGVPIGTEKPDRHVSLGDVIVADQPILYYEPAKEGHAGRESRPQSLTVDIRTMEEFLRICARMAQGYELRRGPIASGEKLIDAEDSPTRDIIRGLSGRALAVEMEAAGVAAAVREMQAASDHSVLLVVKGVSDDAANKHGPVSKGYRQLASQHAAELLSRFIREYRLKQNEQPDYLPLGEIRWRAKALCNSLKPWVSKPIDPVSAARVLHPLDNPPFLFYRWDLAHTQMHWVDFHFLLIIRGVIETLASLGLDLPVHLLVSDLKAEIRNEGHANTKQVVKAVLSDKAQVHWLSQTRSVRGRIGDFGEARGFDADAFAELDKNYEWEKNQLPIPLEYQHPDSYEVAQHWLQYIGWLARYQNRCIYLHWQRHAATMEKLLLHYVEFNPLVIPTPDLTLDGALGKFDPPGEHLLIDPPRFDSILNWLEKEQPWNKKIEDFSMHLAIGLPAEPAPDEEIREIIAGRTSLERRLKGKEDFADAADKIIQILAYWKRLFFKGWA
jgi:nucleoside phosphorylase